ncbi:MAG: FkbM family methyltransferase [Pseudomonadota bacterium]
MARFTVNGIALDVPDALLTPRIEDKLTRGTYEADERRAAVMRLRPGMRVLELGAGLGFIAASCAQVTGAENVTVIEANPTLLPVLRDTFARNGQAGIRLIHGAVTGEAAGEPDIGFSAGGAFWAGRIADRDGQETVAVPRLAIGDLFDLCRPELVVMDIEGAEEHLFDTPWPACVSVVVMELHPKRYPDRAIKRMIDCLSASGLTYDPGPSVGRVLCLRRLRGGGQTD